MNLGFVAVGSTIHLLFTTHAQTGAAVAPNSAFEAADVILYKDGSATQRTSQAGWTMTSPFDSITGLHQLAIDLSDNTDAGFYAAGSSYKAVLSPDETVDGLATVRVIGWFTIGVQPANVTQFGGTAGTFASGVPAVNATQVSGDSAAADNLETAFDDTAGAVPWLGITDQGTAQSASATGLVLRAAAAFADDTLIGCVLSVFGSTQGYWQHRIITDNALSGDTVAVDTWTVTPSGTITYKIWGAPPASAPVTTALTDIQSRLPAALVSGRIDASVGAMAAGVVTAAAVATDAIDADALADGAITAATFAASAIDATAIASNAITAAKIAADAITAAKIADGAIDAATFAAGAINAAAIASDAITDAKVASDVTIASVTGAVGSVASGGITAASFGANAINAAKLDPDVTTELQSGLATASALATVAGFLDTEIAAILALLDDPRTEPGQGAPPVNPDLATKIDYLYKAWRNKKDNNGTETKLYADDGSTVDHKQTTSESGGTVTKGEWATGA
jgi:hypothetical protein